MRLDGSPFREQALRAAITIARRAGALLHLVHVHVPIVPSDLPEVGRLDEDIRTQETEYPGAIAQGIGENFGVQVTTSLLEGPVTGAIRDLGEVIERWLAPHSLEAKAEVRVHGSPAEAILQCASDDAVDVIAMTTHGRSVSRMLLGSIADKVLRGASVPVLLYRPTTG